MNSRFFPSALALMAALLLPSVSRAQTPAGPIVRSIEVQYAGATTVSREKILANMQTRVGRPYDERIVEDDIRNLYATGNITNVRIFGEPVADGVRVIVVLQAKAQITEVNLTGVSRLKPGRVRKEISAKPGDGLNEASLEADRQKIIEYYSGRGFTEADVRYNIDANERLGTARVTFEVNEGGKVTITSVRFEGNDNIGSGELKKVITTKPKGLLNVFGKAPRLSAESIDADIRAIRDLYQSRGYIDADVSARTDRTDGRVDVTFVVREGPVYNVGAVNFVGAQVFSEGELTKDLKTQPGAVYSPQSVRSDIKTISDLYGSRGYLDFQAAADPSPGGRQVVNVTFRVEEGVQSYVERINISGNTRTKDKVIRREIAVAPGDVFNTVRMDASKQRLLNMNYFSRVDTYPQDSLVPGRKDLNVIVEEKRTGSFNFGAGFSSIDNLIGFAEITQGNFDITRWPYLTGAGQKFRMRVQYGTRRKDFVISLTEPYFLDYRISVGAELFYSEAQFVSTVYDERRYGGEVFARKALTDFTYIRFGYRLENIGIFNIDRDVSEEIRREEGERLKSQVSAGITYDTRDSVFLTRRGERVDLLGYVAGGPLGGDTDIYGFNLQGSKYILLPWDTILTLNGEVANVATWSGGDRVPIFDRLYLGGANSLRGFRFRDVGPKDEDGEPIGGNTLARITVEYTFPIVEKVRGALFYDAGFVNRGSYDFGTGNINSDVGIGVRLDLPIGPIRIDYGIPISADEHNDSNGRFNFNIGYQF